MWSTKKAEWSMPRSWLHIIVVGCLICTQQCFAQSEEGSGERLSYREVLKQYKAARSAEPILADMSLREFAERMNTLTNSHAYDEGFNDSWLRRAQASFFPWGILALVAALGLICFVLVWGRQNAMIKRRCYDVVAKEIAQTHLDRALWTKAFAESDGDHDRARALYIRLRIAQLRKSANASQ
jgi:hypothetical protein